MENTLGGSFHQALMQALESQRRRELMASGLQGLPESTNVEDRTGVPLEYWMADPIREGEQTRMRMDHQYNRNTPLDAMGLALGGNLIDQKPQNLGAFAPKTPGDAIGRLILGSSQDRRRK